MISLQVIDVTFLPRNFNIQVPLKKINDFHLELILR